MNDHSGRGSKEPDNDEFLMRALQYYDFDEKRAARAIREARAVSKAETVRSFERRLSFLEAPTVKSAIEYFKGDKLRAGAVLLQAEREAFKDGVEAIKREIDYLYTMENTALKGMRVTTAEQ